MNCQQLFSVYQKNIIFARKNYWLYEETENYRA